jgi:alpha,alpha-trehalase
LRSTVRFRRQILDFEITQEEVTVTSRPMTAHPVTISYRGQDREISPGQSFTFRLIPEIKPDRAAREREQQRAEASIEEQAQAS